MTIAWLSVGVLVTANVLVTFFVVRSLLFSSAQKLAQCALIWLVPVLGCIGVGIFLYSQRDNPLYNTRAYPEHSEKANLSLVEPAIHNIEGGHEP